MDYMEISKIKFYKSDEEFFKAKIGKRVILMTTKGKKYIVNLFLILEILCFLEEKAQVCHQLFTKK